MSKNRCKFLFTLILAFATFYVYGQSKKPTLELGSTKISLNQNFSITIKQERDRDVETPVFPELPGFEKNGVQQSSQSSYSIINGKMTSSNLIIHTCLYKAEKEGTYNISDAKVKIGKDVYTINPFEVKVGAAQSRQTTRRRSVFEDFFNDPFFGGSSRQRQYDYSDVSNDGQLIINTDKNDVFVGEPIHMEVDFLIPMDKEQFARPTNQNLRKIQEFMMAQRPENCWEEVIEFDEVISEITIKGKKYKKYKLFEAVYYPVNNEDVVFKKVSIDMNAITKVSKQTDLWGQHRGQSERTTFAAPAKKIKVRDLPDHPLKNEVAVGNYYLKEWIDSTSCSTGSALKYKFKIVGEGNINGIREPYVKSDDDVEILGPESDISIFRKDGRVFGNKEFEYFVIPNEPGDLMVSDRFEFVYFNYKTEKYDTLRSNKVIHVDGASLQNEMISKKGFGAFYDMINTADNTLESRNKSDKLQLTVNILSIGFMCCTIGLFIYRRRKDRDG